MEDAAAGPCVAGGAADCADPSAAAVGASAVATGLGVALLRGVMAGVGDGLVLVKTIAPAAKEEDATAGSALPREQSEMPEHIALQEAAAVDADGYACSTPATDHQVC